MDLNMPIMDGREACKRILEIYKNFNEKQICQKDIVLPAVMAGVTESGPLNPINSAETPITAGIGAGLVATAATAIAEKTTYVERKPVMIASSAHITEETHK